MLLMRRDNWYRPYSLTLNNHTYILDSIVIYDENGIITQCSGWFESLDNGIRKDIDNINIPMDIKDLFLKRKEDFKIKNGFVISQGKDYSDLKATLYLHKEVINLKSNGYFKKYGAIRESFTANVDNQNIDFENNVKYLENDLYKLRDDFEKVGKEISGYNLKNKEQLDNIIKDLKRTGNALLKEMEYIENYTVEDFIKENSEK